MHRLNCRKDNTRSEEGMIRNGPIFSEKCPKGGPPPGVVCEVGKSNGRRGEAVTFLGLPVSLG